LYAKKLFHIHKDQLVLNINILNVVEIISFLVYKLILFGC